MKLTLKKMIASILCISMIPSMMTGCKKESTSYSHTDFAMGTVTNITLYGTSEDLEQTEQKIIDMEKKLEKQQLSWRLKSSQVSKINQELEQNNGKTKVTGNLKNWLQQAIKISQDSYADGRNTVDPTIGALTKLWDFESSSPNVPDANKIKKAISGDLSENSQHVTVKDNGEILACDKNTKIDLGAYGKGIGTDEAIKIIKKDKEITGAMVALGGSIVVYGEKSDGSDWNLVIQSPNGKDGEVLGGIKVKSGTSISTSGDYEKTFTDKKTGKRYFHILESKTGYSVKTDIRSCTIICNSGLNADGLSTACFSLGVKKSQKLLKEYNGIKGKTFEDILDFHVRFERIHPFQDGNGRVGRLILFKECLKYNIVPFMIDDQLKMFYYRGLKEWDYERGYLMDTCLSAQDKYKAYLDYFRIAYENNKSN